VARGVNREELRDRIRRLADVRSTVRWTDAIINDLINEAVPELQDLILSENDTYLLTFEQKNIVAGTASVALPTDFYKLRGVDILDSSGEWRTLQRFNFQARWSTDSQITARTDLMYSVQGDTLVFHAEPGWSQTNGVMIWYWYILADLINDITEFNGQNGWDKWIVYKVAIEIMVADEQDITSMAALLGAQEQRIRKAASVRDRANPPVVRDVRRRFARPHDRLPRP